MLEHAFGTTEIPEEPERVVLSLPYLLDLLVPSLAQAADGDPATRVEHPDA